MSDSRPTIAAYEGPIDVAGVRASSRDRVDFDLALRTEPISGSTTVKPETQTGSVSHVQTVSLESSEATGETPSSPTEHPPETSIGRRIPSLEVRDLRVATADRQILQGVSLSVYPGELHAIMGPNGSGKSTLASTIAGKPSFEVTSGKVLLSGQDITELAPDERGRAGLFLAFQYPEEIPGVTILQMLRAALSQRTGKNYATFELRLMLQDALRDLQMDPSFADRYVNEGFSGGEKKRCEILQLAILEPAVAILDETDSGLDIDALRIVAEGVEKVRTRNPKMAIVLITHYQRILKYLKPDAVHVLVDGQIVASGGAELAVQLEREGYEGFLSTPVR